MVIYCNKKETDLKCLECEYVYDDDEALYCNRKRRGLMNEEFCVMCGKPIPEGRMVCHSCENEEPIFDTVKTTVSFEKITDVRDFVSLVSRCRDDVAISSGKFKVDAKSIMAVFSLDLTKPLEVEFYGNIPYEVKEGIKTFMANYSFD